MMHRRLFFIGLILFVLFFSTIPRSLAQQAATGTILTNANARATPDANGLVLFSVSPGLSVTVEARSRDSQWALIRTPLGHRGWVKGRQVQLSVGIETLPISGESISPTSSIAAPVAPQTAPGVRAAASGLARTPPMGWNSWNHFHCGIDETLIRSTTDQMVGLGLKSVGYNYVIVDDCWQGPRDSNGNLTADAQRFPSGIKALAAYVHSRGLKFGIYSSRGTTTCGGFPGSLGFEAQDAAAFAGWGVDYVKYDGCPYDISAEEGNRRYQTMAKAIRTSGRPMLMSIVGGGYVDWYPNMVQLNRTTGDMVDDWGVMLARFDENAAFAGVARPGYWNDPDALEVGNGNMTKTEYQTHFSLWAISAAPLIVSADLQKLDPDALGILTNREIIAVDQDALGVQGHKISGAGRDIEIWVKRLQGQGQWAAVLLNRTGANATISLDWNKLAPTMTSASVRDLWGGSNLGTFKDNFRAVVQPHGVVFIKLSGS